MTLPRLVATDLDGTLLRPDTTVGARTRRALDRVRAAGVLVVPVTARSPIGLVGIAEPAGFDSWGVCANGAYAWHFGESRALFSVAIETEVVRELLTGLRAAVPSARFAVVRNYGWDFVAEEGYAALSVHRDHSIQPRVMRRGTLVDLAAEPCLKIVVRSSEHTPAELFDAVAGLGIEGCTPTLSGAPFLEVAAAGVSKATGLARLCELLKIADGDVVAFGDARNDVEMLTWAGHGVAMGNAMPEAQVAADEILPATNADEAVADWLEGLLAGVPPAQSTS
ncbi:HAD family hydrolase [Granulicoccus sp. GXG6511]|uniref:HAD family hydrolase n=1 Tax=Granulicoccus sp. GXG6511 TaxID=3381351 RepID=UPI003D7C5DC6